MFELFIFLLLFICLIVAVVLVPFYWSARNSTNTPTNLRQRANVELYHQHKQELAQDFANGRLDQENYHYLLAELDKSLLLDSQASEQLAQQELNIHAQLAPYWPIVLVSFILLFSGASYYYLGAYQQLQQPQLSKQQAHSQVAKQAVSKQQSLSAQVRQLTALSQQQPDNSDNWYALGQALIKTGDFKQAMLAYDQVMRIEGTQADILGAKVQAAYYLANQQITTSVQSLIDQALALDPIEPSTTILLGMHAFTAHQYQQAIDYWQQVIAHKAEQVDLQTLKGALAEAQRRLAFTTNQATKKNELRKNSTQDSNQGHSPRLKVQVALSAELAARLTEANPNDVDKAVFIYALATNGQRMPLAAVKVMVSQLPAMITLTDSNAMTPAAKLSDAEQVDILAVVANSGVAGIKSGDFKGQVSKIDVNHDKLIKLIIKDLVP